MAKKEVKPLAKALLQQLAIDLPALIREGKIEFAGANTRIGYIFYEGKNDNVEIEIKLTVKKGKS